LRQAARILGGLTMFVPAIGSILSMIPPILVGAPALSVWPHRIALIAAR
jgi:hypothetical protein